MNKAVVLTGGSYGLGLCMTESLLQKTDLTVVTLSRSRTPGLEHLHLKYPDRLFTFRVDISKRCLDEEIAEITRNFEVYALINNAAVAAEGLFPLVSMNTVEKMLRINLIAPMILARAFSREMILRAEGRILFISSVAATRGFKGMAAYSASKAALEGLTRSLARELGPRNITVNSVAPGFIRTQMNDSVADLNFQKIIGRQALNKTLSASDVANTMLFLLSEAGGAITGQSVVVDCGSSV